jgi:hypothetical protein
MAQKIVRDVNKKGSLVISLKEEKPEKIRNNDSVDISASGKTKFVLTKGKRSLLRDVNKEQKTAPVFFLQIDAERISRFDRINEIIRMAAAGIAILFVINIVNVYQRGTVLKDAVIASASGGYENIMEGGEHAMKQDFPSAEGSFNEAEQKFAQAMNEVSFLNLNKENFFASEKTITSMQNLLEAGKNISEAGADFSSGIRDLQELPLLFIRANSEGQKDGGGSSLTEILKKDLTGIEKAVNAVGKANENMRSVSADVMPAQYREKLESAKEKINKFNDVLLSLKAKIPAVLELLGDRYPHRYLILLQNDTEARPTGGFIGSIMIVDVNDGYITKSEFHDVYDFDGQLKEDIQAPPDIAKITDNWRLRDSNYSPDFAVSAEKAAWFLQKEKGPSVDTVIAINQSFIAELLDITGPITVEGFNGKIDKTNYQTVLTYIIESKLSGVDKPKEVLGKFISAFQERLMAIQDWPKVLSKLTQALKKKSIMVYSRNEEVQAVIDELGISGRVIKNAPKEDYLNVVNTSIGGNKSDLYMLQSVKHNTVVNNTGLLIDDLTIKRRHTWNDNSMEKISDTLKSFGFNDIPEGIKDIMGRGINKSSVKVYVPLGSKIIDVEGVPGDAVKTYRDEEIQKTFFAFEMETAADSSKEVTIIYQLPESLEMTPVDTYRLYVQSQPSINPNYFYKQIFFSAGLKSYKQFPEDFKKYDSGNIYYENRLTNDLNLAAVVGG